MAKHFIITRIEQGKIVNPAPLRTLFSSLQDGRYLIEVNSADKRSSQQNRYYFGIVVPMIQKGILDLGTELTKDETHEFLKSRFNSVDIVNEGTGEVISVPRSTTGLNKEQFSQYIEKIQRFASEFLGIVIPDPGQQVMIEY